MKKCRTCGEEKPFGEFGIHSIRDGNTWHYPDCNECRRAIAAAQKAGVPSPGSIRRGHWHFDEALGEAVKRCPICRIDKPASEFYSQGIRDGKQSYRSHCRQCTLTIKKETLDRERAEETRQRYHPRVDECTGTVVKRCPQCQIEKPLETCFGWQVKARNKRFPLCKECKRRVERQWRKADPERQRSYKRKGRRQYSEAESIRCCRRCGTERSLEGFPWRGQFRSHTCLECYLPIKHADDRRSHQRHREERLVAQARSYQANREQRQKQAKAYRAKDPEKWRLAELEAQARRRARKLASPVIEKIDRREIIERDRRTCYLCGHLIAATERVTLDHVIPLVLGGPHTRANLRVACHSCNSRKSKMTLEEYRRRQEKIQSPS